MTQFNSKPASGYGRSLVVRWRILAQKRLDHLIELYQTGRWKLYHAESDFLEMVQEARAALKVWEELAPPDPALDKPVEVSIEQAMYRLNDSPSLLPNVLLDDVAPEQEARKS